MKLKIRKLNESFVQIECEKSTAYELRDAFTFKAKNYKFHPLYKNRVWDGNIRLFDIRTNTINLGLTRKVIEWAKSLDYEVELEDVSDFAEPFAVNEADEFIKSLDIPSHITDRDYQKKSFINAIRKKRLVVVSPTASGKSLVIYTIIRKYIDMLPGHKGLLVVPTTTLVEQMYKDFQSYGFDVDQYCWRVHGQAKNVRTPSMAKNVNNTRKDTDLPITITTWQSIYKQPKKWFEQFSWIVGDEAHNFQAKSLAYIMDNLVNAEYRFGTTGSLDDAKVHKLTLEGHFGPVQEVVTTKELMDRKLISELNIKGLILKYDDHLISKRMKEKWKYQDEIDFLIGNEERNRFLCNLALSLPENTLMLYNHVDKHGHQLKAEFDRLIKDTDSKKKVFYIHGGIPTEERETIRHYVNSNPDCIVLASYGTYSTGINIPNLQNIIFAIGFKSKIRNLQSIGRSLRLDGKNNKATLYDICDNMSKGQSESFSTKHFKERLELYYKQDFKVKLYKVNISTSGAPKSISKETLL